MGGGDATGGVTSTGGEVSGGGEGGMGGSPVPTEPKELVVVAHGTSVSLLEIVDDQLEVVSTASLPAEGLLGGHRIFNVIQEPGKQRLFVASSNDCSENAHWCWGNGRIDLFTFTQSEIRYEGLAYKMDNAAFLADGISCAEGTEEDTEFLGQEGYCQPNGLAFSPDGTRLYVDDDNYDTLEIFEVNPKTGELTFLAEGDPEDTDVHGLAAHPEGTYVYNGTNVFDVSDDQVVRVTEGIGGNGTRVIPGDPNLLITTAGTSDLHVFDLTDPEAPAETATATFGNNEARDVAVTSDLGRFVTVGMNKVRLLSFDGSDFTPLGEHEVSGLHSRQHRRVALAGDSEQFAVVAYFRGGNGNSIQGGGAVLYRLDSESDDGPLEEKHVLTLDGPSFVTLQVIAE